MSPNFLSPPIVNASNVFNVNDKICIIEVQQYNGSIWVPLFTIQITSNSGYLFGGDPVLPTRARASADGFVSDWSSDNYNYINTDNIVASANGTTIINPNNFTVYVIAQLSNDGINWVSGPSIGSIAANSNSLISLGNFAISRVRFAKIGPGISVSSWST
jgi:hypothetical protein